MSLAQEIRSVFEIEKEDLVVQDLLDRIDERGFGMLLIILSFPVALPFTPPGVSAPFGILSAALGWQMMRGKESPWFPEKIRQKPLKEGASAKLLKMMSKVMGFFERFIRPRGAAAYRQGWFRRLLGVFVLLSAGVMILPIPVAGSVAAVSVFFIGVGLQEDDLVFGLLGALLAAGGFVATGLFLVILIRILSAGFSGDFGQLWGQAEREMRSLLGRD
jgi:hypothetical protein